jgi:hypothetical protein
MLFKKKSSCIPFFMQIDPNLLSKYCASLGAVYDRNAYQNQRQINTNKP